VPRPAATAAAFARRRTWFALATLLIVVAVTVGGIAAPAARQGGAAGCPPGTAPHPTSERPLTRPQWLAHTVMTEYWPAPERWFVGRAVAAPGLPGLHRVDWLYSARGLPMEGDGVALDGRRYHFGGPWHLSWVNASGAPTTPCNTGFWTNGRPFWPAFGWRDAAGAVTFPLAGGGWSNGPPTRELPPPASLHFLPGSSLPLRYWRSVAVDPHLIPLGSRVFVPALCGTPSRGWLVAADTGGTVISGHHIDVYRPAPARPDTGEMLTGQRIFVIPPAFHGRVRAPACA
jgi:3D domain